MAIPEGVKRRLWASSAGICQNPSCRADLFNSFANGDVTNIEELAHIIARQDDGPRGDPATPFSARDQFDNIIVLCPSCHTLVDKAPKQFPPQILSEWKRTHAETVRRALLTRVYQSRSDLRPVIHRLWSGTAEFTTHMAPTRVMQEIRFRMRRASGGGWSCRRFSPTIEN